MTTATLPTTIQDLLTEAADDLATRDLDLNQPAPASAPLVVLRATARRIHGIAGLIEAHRDAAWTYDRAERIADSRIVREIPATAINTQRAIDRANTAWDALREAWDRLQAAQKAADADVAAALDAIGDLPAGATRGQVIARLYEAAGLTTEPEPEPRSASMFALFDRPLPRTRGALPKAQRCRRHPNAAPFMTTCPGCAQETHDAQYGASAS